MKKLNIVFVTFFVLVYVTKECQGCLKENVTYNVGILLKSGSSFYQECYCETPTDGIRNLKWLDGSDQEIPTLMGPGTKPLVYTEWVDRSLNLFIPSLGKSLAGTYKCVSDVQGKRHAIVHEVVAYDPLIFVNTPENQSIVKGRDSFISCDVKADSVPRIDWMKGQGDEIKNDEKYEITPKGLIIKNVTDDDTGVYKCTVNVAGTGENADRYIMVDIIIAPEIVNLASNPAPAVVAGEYLSLECRARGFPLPQYSWNKVRNTINETKANITWRQEYNKIVFENITEEDRGTYACVAHNDAGDVTEKISIEVFTAPVITEFRNLTVEEGTSANITCRAFGRPQPNITITFELEIDETIPSYVRNISDTELELIVIFSKVHRSNEGICYCNASNKVDSTIEVIFMEVLYKPNFTKNYESIWAWNDKTITLNCEHESRPTAYLIWRYLGDGNETQTSDPLFDIFLNRHAPNNILTLKGKHSYGKYQCTARNHLGEAKKTFDVIEAHTPNTVKNVTWEVSATSVTFNIIPPDVNGPDLIGYTAEYDEEANYYITNIHLNRTWAVGVTYKIDKLKPNTKYLIRFAGVNEVGVGPYGNFLKFDTPEKSIPEPPSWDFESRVVEIQSDNKMLKLKSPEHNGDTIDYYAIKYCRTDNEECLEQRISPTNELNLDHLEQNATYRLELVAHNSVGNSTAANIELIIPVQVAELSLAEEARSAGVIIGASVVVVLICILLLDLLLFATRRQGMIANCYHRKNKKRKSDGPRSRDKKGLLKENSESVTGDTMKRPDNGHKNEHKSTGIITGKHSSV